jgi:hypothetical protein
MRLCAWCIVLPLPSLKALPLDAPAVAEDEVFKKSDNQRVDKRA